jgi:hypothetical protein
MRRYRHRPGNRLLRVAVLLPVVAVLAIAVLVVSLAGFLSGAGSPLRTINLGALAAFGFLAYMAGHALRVLRLALIAADARIGLRDLAAFHLLSSAVSLAIPFKLGELFRITELSNFVGGILRSAIIVWIERTFDIAVLVLLLTIAVVLEPAVIRDLMPILSVSALFVLLSLVLVFLVPDNLRRVAIYIICRYNSRRSVGALKLISATRRAIGEVPRLLRGRTSALAAVTLLIWTCELLSLGLLLRLVDSAATPLIGLLSFVSAITAGGTLPGHLTEAPIGVAVYLSFTQVPLAIMGLVAGLYYLRWRLGWSSRRTLAV